MHAAIPRGISHGFSLVELLMVIGIVGILMAVLAANIEKIPEASQRSASEMNAREIAFSSVLYMSENGRWFMPRTQVAPGPKAFFTDSIEDVALGLAKYQGLNLASIWFVDTDPRLRGVELPVLVADGDPAFAKSCSPEFLKTSPKARAYVTGLPANAPASTPLLWTYGLDSATGKWVAASPWGGLGGHVAFLDGHVEWYSQVPSAFFATQTVKAGKMTSLHFLNAMGNDEK